MTDLNEKQQKIIDEEGGVVIVNAGPGTGKTKTLTHKIAHLVLNKKVNSSSILALTFTQRATLEMRERLKNLIKELPIITTFHGFAYQILSEQGILINLISEEERDVLIRTIKKERKIKFSIRDLKLQISLYKSSLDMLVPNESSELFRFYQEELKKRELFDFDDLILNAAQLLKGNEDFRKLLQKRFQYILVDEFQDTNDLQYQLLKLILNENPNLFVIGDPFQSIYGFRGASSQIFKTLKKDFPKIKEEFLEINYRSSKSIVEISNLLFSNKLKANSLGLGQVLLVETLNEYSEAEWIIKFISEKIGGLDLLKAKNDNFDEGIDFGDFAIIYRTHGLSRALENRLKDSGLPFQIIKEDSFLEGDHIKLLSMHAAKGLEFKYVFICGFEEGLIPLIKDNYEDDLEEEKRLFYVGMTRAKEGLYILHVRKRQQKETRTSSFKKLIESPNLLEIKDQNMEVIFKKQKSQKLKKSQMSLF